VAPARCRVRRCGAARRAGIDVPFSWLPGVGQAELIALVAGNAILDATGHSRYVAAWTALVVGVHFVGFGRLYAPMFYWLGAAFIVAAVVGAAAGAAYGTRQAIDASTGLIAAASLFVAGGWGLLEAAASRLGASRR
jgi:hypothetical protein